MDNRKHGGIRKSTNLTGSVENNIRVFTKWTDITLKAKSIPVCCFTVDAHGNIEVLTEITEREVLYLMKSMIESMKHCKPLIITKNI